MQKIKLATQRKLQSYTVVTWEINYTEIILKLFPCFILHATTSETETKLFQPLEEFYNYFSDNEHVGKYS